MQHRRLPLWGCWGCQSAAAAEPYLHGDHPLGCVDREDGTPAALGTAALCQCRAHLRCLLQSLGIAHEDIGSCLAVFVLRYARLFPQAASRLLGAGARQVAHQGPPAQAVLVCMLRSTGSEHLDTGARISRESRGHGPCTDHSQTSNRLLLPWSSESLSLASLWRSAAGHMVKGCKWKALARPCAARRGPHR